MKNIKIYKNLDDLQSAQWTLIGPVWVSVQIKKFLQERVAVEMNKALMVCLSDHLSQKLENKRNNNDLKCCIKRKTNNMSINLNYYD